MTKRTIFHLRRWLLLLAITVLWVVASKAQKPTSTEKLVIPLTVIDRDGKFVLDLTAEHIVVRGVEAEWQLVFDDGPRRIVLLVDLSGSMGGIQKWNRARRFIESFMQAAPLEEYIALYAFAERHELVVPLTRDRRTIKTALVSLPEPRSRECKRRFGTRTALADALLAVAETPLNTGDVILLVGDFIWEDSSQASREAAAAVLVGRGLRLFHFIVVGVMERLPEEIFHAHAAHARKLIEGTGGMLLVSWHSSARTNPGWVFPQVDQATLARDAYMLMKYIYRLELQLKAPLKRKKKLNVSVRDKRIKKQFKPKLFFPKVLYPKPASIKDLAAGQKPSE